MPTSRPAQENRRPSPARKPPGVPALATSDRPAFDASQLAALHRALLATLAVAILALLPVILRGGASGQAWTEPRMQLTPWGVSRPQVDAPEPAMSRQAAPARP